MSKKISGAKLPDPQENREEGEEKRRGEDGEGELVSTHFSEQSYVPAGKHTSNNRSATRSTTVLLLAVLNVVCRVQTVTSHQQETVSKNDSRFYPANKQFFAQTAARRPMVGGGGGGGGGVRLMAARRLISVGGGGVRNSAARRHRRLAGIGVDL
jgi:hypothetical protein